MWPPKWIEPPMQWPVVPSLRELSTSAWAPRQATKALPSCAAVGAFFCRKAGRGSGCGRDEVGVANAVGRGDGHLALGRLRGVVHLGQRSQHAGRCGPRARIATRVFLELFLVVQITHGGILLKAPRQAPACATNCVALRSFQHSRHVVISVNAGPRAGLDGHLERRCVRRQPGARRVVVWIHLAFRQGQGRTCAFARLHRESAHHTRPAPLREPAQNG